MEAPMKIDLSFLPEKIRIGTSSFSSDDWRGVFYPDDMKPREYLPYYAGIFNTVEIDATWHAVPGLRTVQAWADRTPDDFIFSLKVPKEITHTSYLVDCEETWNRFLRVLEPLGDKHGPLLFQFPYVAKRKDPREYATGLDFLSRLSKFIPLLSKDRKYVVEVRNEKWLKEPLFELLGKHDIALALTSYFTLPGPGTLYRNRSPLTSTFSYIRFLGHHRHMEKLIKEKQESGKEKKWDEILVDRQNETTEWAEFIETLLEESEELYIYFNNHFAGFAPGSIDLFIRTWGRVHREKLMIDD